MERERERGRKRGRKTVRERERERERDTETEKERERKKERERGRVCVCAIFTIFARIDKFYIFDYSVKIPYLNTCKCHVFFLDTDLKQKITRLPFSVFEQY